MNCFKFKVVSIKYLFMISSVMQEIYSFQKIATSMASMSNNLVFFRNIFFCFDFFKSLARVVGTF